MNPGPEIPTFFLIFAGLILTGILTAIGYSVFRAMSNSMATPQRLQARVATKRTNVWGRGGDVHTSTSYYVTFEFTSGERMELSVKGKAYGQLAEGDQGVLDYQGTRFNSFLRQS